MKIEPEYNLDNYVFYDKLSWYSRFNYVVSISMYRFAKTPPILPPIRHKKFFKKLMLTLTELGRTVGINNEKMLEILDAHQKRYIYYKFMAASLSFVIGYIPVLITSLLVGIVVFFIAMALNLNIDSPSFIAFLTTVITTTMYITILYGIRVAGFIVDRRFADTLCIVTSLYLLIELSRDDSLLIPNRQREILTRIRELARTIMVMPYLYESPNNANNLWIRDYFKRIEDRVREFERWVIAPQETTLSDLRKEVNELTHLFISRNHEAASYELPSIPEDTLQSHTNRITSLFGRIIGLAIPGFILSMLYFYPDQINNTGLDKNIVGLISLAWILLTIDASLGLGVVERISGLAKTIRDLK